MRLTRRAFARSSALTVGGMALGGQRAQSMVHADGKTYRAAIIGRTGGGDYGHGHERIFSNLGNVTLEAIADQDAEGLKRAAERSGARRLYRDYREMLSKEKPELVAVAPRHADCHRDMALEAIRVCRGLFIEKPLTETVTDADAIVDAANRARVKILVAHNRRYMSEFVHMKTLLQEGLAGRVRQVHMQGKQDTRVGGEDMIVLGVHDFDLMRFYFGDPLWCLGNVTRNGRDITRTDVQKGREPYLVAGDTVHALFAFPGNIMVHWSSVKTNDGWNASNPRTGEKWSFEIHGTKGILAWRSGIGVSWFEAPFLVQNDDAAGWKDLPAPAGWDWPEHARHPIKSLIHAVETGNSPVCSGEDGRWAVEMVAAVYESQRTRSRVPLPLKRRDNPLLHLEG